MGGSEQTLPVAMTGRVSTSGAAESHRDAPHGAGKRAAPGMGGVRGSGSYLPALSSQESLSVRNCSYHYPDLGEPAKPQDSALGTQGVCVCMCGVQGVRCDVRGVGRVQGVRGV